MLPAEVFRYSGYFVILFCVGSQFWYDFACINTHLPHPQSEFKLFSKKLLFWWSNERESWPGTFPGAHSSFLCTWRTIISFGGLLFCFGFELSFCELILYEALVVSWCLHKNTREIPMPMNWVREGKLKAVAQSVVISFHLSSELFCSQSSFSLHSRERSTEVQKQ